MEMGLVALTATALTLIVKLIATGESAAAGIKTEGMTFWGILLAAIGGLAYTNAARARGASSSSRARRGLAAEAPRATGGHGRAVPVRRMSS